MNPEVERLFQAALDLPDSDRAQFIENQTADPFVRREVLSLLLHDGMAEPLFASAIQGVAGSLCSSLQLPEGCRIGSYRILSVLGRGGMGTVYLAERADGCFEQRVALKVIHSPDAAAFLVDRFQQERRILAQLNHPNIARLLDGGQTPDRSPYLVMEYVDGQSVDEFCERQQLPVPARLGLFLKICDAVRYAHQKLIVHRDLKPANIIVTSAGEPKLLDFGIAKIMDPENIGNTQASTRILTPAYASPEQIRGEAITTATDIYSLGAVLYHLLAGSPPHDIAKMAPLEAAQAIAEGDVRAIDALPTDLNAILQKALHRDPVRRYDSAGELASDLTRFLEGRAVAAAPDSFAYRARKFLRRNWVMATAIASVMLALAAGAGATLWQERRAERRFADVRRLASTFLFDFEDSIHNLPGATKARLLVLDTASEYLNRLAAEAGSDRQLLRELADAYKKLGDVQGNITGGNLGRFQQAAESYGQGLALRNRLGDEHSSDWKIQANYLSNLVALASVKRFAGDAATADRLRLQEIELADRWTGWGPRDADLLAAAAFAYSDLSHAQRLREDFAAAALNAKKNVDLLKRAYELDPKNTARVRTLASGYVGAGYVELDAGRYAAAIDQFSRGNQLLDQPLTVQPKDVALRRQRMVLLEKIGEATGRLHAKEKGAQSDSLPFFQEAYRIGDQLATEDPADEGVQTDLAGLCQLYGSTLQMQGRAAEGLPLLTRGIAIYSRQWTNVPEDTNAAFNLAVTRVWTSDCRRDVGDLRGALEETRKAAEVWDRLLALRPGTFRYLHQKADNLNTMGNLLAMQGDADGALECFRAGLEIAEKLPTQDAGYSTSVVRKELRDSERKLARRLSR